MNWEKEGREGTNRVGLLWRGDERPGEVWAAQSRERGSLRRTRRSRSEEWWRLGPQERWGRKEGRVRGVAGTAQEVAGTAPVLG